MNESRWPTCLVCGESHRPASSGNGGPPRCYHCGLRERRCRCAPSLPGLFWPAVAAFTLAAYLLGLAHWPV